MNLTAFFDREVTLVARQLLGAELLVEEPGRSPIAWQGGQLSRVIAALADRVAA